MTKRRAARIVVIVTRVLNDWPEAMPNTSNPANADEQLRAARQSRLPQRNQPAPRRLLLFSHPRLSASLPLAQEMAAHLRAVGITTEIVTDKDTLTTQTFEPGDMVVALGGDGWMLHAGRITAEAGVPVLGVNLGRLGFLAEVQPAEWRSVFDRVRAGDYWIEQRLMLRTEVWRGDQNLQSFDVLNEVVVSRGAVVRAVRLETHIDGGWLTTYVADGLIIATPTGSTAYALAVGGPILPPDLKNILLIPVAPHLSIERALVLARGSTVTIIVHMEHEAVISGDGAIEYPLRDGDRIIIEAGPHSARFVRTQDPSYFYRTLMERMGKNPAAEMMNNPNA
jgi:NAD+ kinase